MKEKFNDVEPLAIGTAKVTGGRDFFFSIDQFWTQEEARALRDWLDKALGDGWIPCSERMPDTERLVWVAKDAESVGASRFYPQYGHWDYFDREDITHWRDLPKGPKP